MFLYLSITKQTMIYLLITIVAFLLIYLITIYNKLVRNKNLVNEGWSGIDVQLKKRYDLIPAIVKTVKGYSDYEKELQTEITQLRTEGVNAKTVKSQEATESKLAQKIGRLLVIAESYPELKANENFLKLQKQISEVEDAIQKSRRYYNGAVRDFNILIESFPSNLVAKIFNYTKKDFFEIESIQAQVPEVHL